MRIVRYFVCKKSASCHHQLILTRELNATGFSLAMIIIYRTGACGSKARSNTHGAALPCRVGATNGKRCSEAGSLSRGAAVPRAERQRTRSTRTWQSLHWWLRKLPELPEIPIRSFTPKTFGCLLRGHKEIHNNFLALRKKLRMSEQLK